MTKKEMTLLAKEMIANGQKCLEADFKKSFPYSDFKEVYELVQSQIAVSAKRKKDREAISKVAEKNKMRVTDFTAAVTLLRNVKMSKYSTGHSMGYSAEIHIAGFSAKRYNGCQTPPNSYGYRPTYGFYCIDVSLEVAKELAKGYNHEMIGGVETFVEVSKAKIKKCFWLAESGSKHSYKVELVSGYVTSGFHSYSFDGCEKWRIQQAERLLKNRADTFATRMSDQQKALEIERKKQRFIGLSHSKAVGNCEVGTMNFAKKHNLDPELGYQVGYLLSLEDSQYTRRLLNA
jgi:hypothetical protein